MRVGHYLWTASTCTAALSSSAITSATAFAPNPGSLSRQRVNHHWSTSPCTTRLYSFSSSSTKESTSNQNDDLENEDDFFISTASHNNNTAPFASTYHAPVMWKECIEALLKCERGQRNSDDKGLVFVDGTLGGGGHSEALLQQLQPGDIVFGCDVDGNALKTASKRLQQYMDSNNHDTLPHFVPVQSNFAQLATRLPCITHPNNDAAPILASKTNAVDGILLDLGVSSHQIDTPERGFAFMADGPLDMRMMLGENDNAAMDSSSLTAADLCNELEEQELIRILKQFGDEPRAKPIARSIIQHRPLATTGQLQEAVAAVVPQFNKISKRKGRTATLARVFQALRIVVNREDAVLQQVLEEVCPQLLRPGGRLVVLSYHSMEDRATKRVMRDGSIAKQRGSPQRDMYGNHIGPAKPFRPVGKFQKASEEEVALNSRARSATLRIAERLEIERDDSEDDDEEEGF